MEVDKKIRETVEQGRLAVIIYTVLGYPDIQKSRRTLQILQEHGINVFETAIPIAEINGFATNQTIKNAHFIACRNGITAKEVIATYSRYRPNLYILHKGTPIGSPANFFKEMEDNVDCVLFGWHADIEMLQETCRSYGIQLAQLVSPLMDRKTIVRLARNAEGLIYLSAAPHPGGSIFPAPLIRRTTHLLKSVTDLPVCCGFGIKRQDDIKLLRSIRHCDGIIIGTQALLELSKGIDSFESYVEQVIALSERPKVD